MIFDEDEEIYLPYYDEDELKSTKNAPRTVLLKSSFTEKQKSTAYGALEIFIHGNTKKTALTGCSFLNIN